MRDESESTVLIVEDDVDLAESVAELLSSEGIACRMAHGADEALTRIDDGFAPKVFLLDVRLGRDDGIALIPRIRERAPDGMFVLMTAHATFDSAIRALKQGADDYLRKPFEPEEMFAVLRRCFERIALAEQARAAETRVRALESEIAHLDRLSLMGEMATSIAHELNQPLAAISAYCEAIRGILEEGDETRVRATSELHEKIITQANRAGQIIRKVRDFARRGETDPGIEDLGELAREAWDMSGPLADARGVEGRLEIAEELPPVFVDRVQIQQVIQNLIRNAMDAMDSMSDREVTIGVRCDAPDVLTVSVRDVGPGIPDDMKPRVLERFVTTKKGGMGIGLSICQGILESLGSKLELDDHPEGGAVFRFSLAAAGSGHAPRAPRLPKPLGDA